MHITTRLLGLAAFALATAGCQGEAGAGNADARTAGADAAPSTAADEARTRTGTIEIDGTTWTVVPAIQCDVFPGPVAYVAGHAAEDESIEIAIDYNPGDRIVGVSVERTDGTLVWRAGEAAVTFDVRGQTIKGEGDFTWPMAGEIRTAKGKFEVRCG